MAAVVSTIQQSCAYIETKLPEKLMQSVLGGWGAFVDTWYRRDCFVTYIEKINVGFNIYPTSGRVEYVNGPDEPYCDLRGIAMSRVLIFR